MRCDSEDGDQQPKTSYWTQQLFNHEANDSGRFVSTDWNIILHIEIVRNVEILPNFHHHDGDCTGPGILYINLNKILLENNPVAKEYQKMIFKDGVQMRAEVRAKKSSMPVGGLCHMDVVWTTV